MFSLNLCSTLLNSRNAKTISEVSLCGNSNSEDPDNPTMVTLVEVNLEDYCESLDVSDAYIGKWSSLRSRPAAPNLRRASNRKAKKLMEHDSMLQLLSSAQDNNCYLSDESFEHCISAKELEHVIETCSVDYEVNKTSTADCEVNEMCNGDNEVNYVSELLSKPEIQISFDFVNGSTKFISQEIINKCLKVSRIGEANLEIPRNSLWAEVENKSNSLDKIQESTYQDFKLTKLSNGKNNEVSNVCGTVIKYPENVELITVMKSLEPLGLTIVNDGNSVKISRIIYGGAAAKCGLFREGDEILAVAGIDIRNKLIDDVYTMLGDMNGEISFIVAPSATKSTYEALAETPMVHFKANFSYDPEEDIRPCRDLGIGFQKGDILHVIDQRDPKWWQAYRDDEYDQPLAGIIPSMDYQICRENALLAVENKDQNKKKMKKQRNFKIFRFSKPDSSEDDLERVKPYEAVDVYWPKQEFKRPVVLIGVPGIGVQEIYKKFMEVSERFSAAIPRTTRPKHGRELDGEEFFFVSGSQFEASISAGSFAEYGKFEKHYYGTTYDAIWTVVNSGKTCVLNFNPSSIRLLRASGLMPFVILVSTPSLERIKQKKREAGESIKEEALMKIIEESREMEEKYDPYIDVVAINKDEEQTFQQIIRQINIIERDPQWVPAAWLPKKK